MASRSCIQRIIEVSVTPSSVIALSEIRIVIEAECSRCGPLSAQENTGLGNIDAALAHTAQTGHVVILNGTVDRGDEQ
jgi:hypothetical protein